MFTISWSLLMFFHCTAQTLASCFFLVCSFILISFLYFQRFLDSLPVIRGPYHHKGSYLAMHNNSWLLQTLVHEKSASVSHLRTIRVKYYSQAAGGSMPMVVYHVMHLRMNEPPDSFWQNKTFANRKCPMLDVNSFIKVIQHWNDI